MNMLLFSSESQTITDFNDGLMPHGKTTDHDHDIMPDETLFTPILAKLQTIKKMKSQQHIVDRKHNPLHQNILESEAGSHLYTE